MIKTLASTFLFIGLFFINIGFSEDKNNTVIATGYGTTYDSSLNNAFRDAIKQYVGIVLDSETILANNEIIKDEILTLSNGNIESYEVISKTEEDGLFIVEIKAIVKNRNIQNKISEKISQSSNTQLDKNKIAAVITKFDTDLDQKALFEKYITSFFEENHDDLLYINNIDLDIQEDSYRDKKVDYNLSFSINFDMQKYKKEINQLKDNLNNIGITHHKRFFISDTALSGDYIDQTHFKLCADREKTCLAIADYIAGKYVYDLYIIDNPNNSSRDFLKDYMVYSYNGYMNSSPNRFSDHLNVFVEISANNETLDLFSDTKVFDGLILKNKNVGYSYLGDYYSAYTTLFIISPNFIKDYQKSYPSVIFNYQGSLHINDIDSINNISTKVELSK